MEALEVARNKESGIDAVNINNNTTIYADSYKNSWGDLSSTDEKTEV